jgi:hypothetical protein
MPDTTTTQVRRITLRLPPILAARMDAAVRVRVADNRKFSLNDWIEEACRAYIDGPLIQSAQPVAAPQQQAPAPRQYIQKPKGWLSELQRMMRLREVDPEEAGREESRMFQGFKPPKGWNFLDLEHRAAHLDAVLPLGETVTIPNPPETEITKPALEQPVTRRTAAEVAAGIKGISLGIPKPSGADSQKQTVGNWNSDETDGW